MVNKQFYMKSAFNSIYYVATKTSVQPQIIGEGELIQ